MKNITNNRFCKHFSYILALCITIGSTHGMKRLHEEPSQPTPSMVEEKPPRTKKMKTIWIKTSDNRIITMPEWQVDQVKVLQLLLLNQRGTNSKNNPLDASHLQKNNGAIVNSSANTFDLIKTALEASQTSKGISTLPSLMTPEEYTILLNTAADLEANALFAVLASKILPEDMQFKIGARMLSSITHYFIDSLATEFASPEDPENAVFLPNAPLIKISSNGQYLLSSSRYDNNTSILWDLSAQQGIRRFPRNILNIHFTPASTYIVSSTMNNGYIVYDYISELIVFNVHNSNCMTFSSDDEYCLYNSTTTPGIINIKSHKNTPDWIDLPALQGHTARINTIQCSPDGNYIVSGSNDDYPNNLILWDGKSFKKITNLVYEGPWTAHIYPVTQTHFTPDSKYIISKDNQENTIVWDVASKKPIAKLDIMNKVVWKVDNQKPTAIGVPIPRLTYNPQNLHTYVSSANPTVRILYGLMLNKFFNHAVFSINENAMGTLTEEPQYKRIICTQYSPIPPFEFRKNVTALPNNNNYNVQYAAESSDSQYLLLAYQPGYITFMFTDTKKLLFIPVYPYQTVTFSPKNDYIIITHPPTVPNDCMFTIWKIDDLKMICDVCTM